MLATFWTACSARADSITVRGADDDTGSLTYDNVKVDHIEADQFYFVINDQMRHRPLAQVLTMKLDDEPDFDAGQTAYDQQKWDAATDAYWRASASTDKSWLKDWINPRLLDAAEKANRFDAATAAWINLANQNADHAQTIKPPLSTDQNALAAAARELDQASNAATGQSRQMILGFLLDVENARQDQAAAANVAKQLEQSQTSSGSDIPPLEQATQITLAQDCLVRGKPDQAIFMVDQAAPQITDPVQQDQALFIKARAIEAQAEAKGDAINRPEAWEDAALAYMRVYVHFRDGPSTNHAAAALMKAAQIEQFHLNQPHAALTLYEKVQSEYKDSQLASQAASEAGRLEGPSN